MVHRPVPYFYVIEPAADAARPRLLAPVGATAHITTAPRSKGFGTTATGAPACTTSSAGSARTTTSRAGGRRCCRP